MAEAVREPNRLLISHPVVAVEHEGGRVAVVAAEGPDGPVRQRCGEFVNCIPVDELVRILRPASPGMLLLSDVSVGGHLAILLIPFGALAAFCFRRDGRRVGTVVSWCVLCAFVVTHLIAVKALKEMSAGTAGVLILLGLTAFAALWLRAESARREQPAQCP